MIFIGHQGCKGYSTGNTLKSIDIALNNNLNTIEIDVRLSKDNIIILYHDEDIIINNKKQLICDINYTDLEKIGIISFERFLDYYKDIDFKIFLEIKKNIKDETFDIVDLIINCLKKRNYKYNLFFFQSFHLPYIEYLINNYSVENYGLLYSGAPTDDYHDIKKLKCKFISCSIEGYSKKFIEDMKKNNIDTYIYTVNDLHYKKFLNLENISGYFTDYPNI